MDKHCKVCGARVPQDLFTKKKRLLCAVHFKEEYVARKHKYNERKRKSAGDGGIGPRPEQPRKSGPTERWCIKCQTFMSMLNFGGYTYRLCRLHYREYNRKKKRTPQQLMRTRQTSLEWAKRNKSRVRDAGRRHDKKRFSEPGSYARKYQEQRKKYPEKFRKKWRDQYNRKYAENPKFFYQRTMRRRLRAMNAQGQHTDEELAFVFDAYNNVCAYCEVAPATTIDHIVALINGGTNFIWNILPACRRCNARKQAKNPLEYITAHTNKRTEMVVLEAMKKHTEFMEAMK